LSAGVDQATDHMRFVVHRELDGHGGKIAIANGRQLGLAVARPQVNTQQDREASNKDGEQQASQHVERRGQRPQDANHRRRQSESIQRRARRMVWITGARS
jgi:hypothetical protein